MRWDSPCTHRGARVDRSHPHSGTSCSLGRQRFRTPDLAFYPACSAGRRHNRCYGKHPAPRNTHRCNNLGCLASFPTHTLSRKLARSLKQFACVMTLCLSDFVINIINWCLCTAARIDLNQNVLRIVSNFCLTFNQCYWYGGNKSFFLPLW